MPRPSSSQPGPRFWRDPALPQVEAREVADGRLLCYERHWHETFSVGAITSGRSTYLNGEHAEQVEQGTLVFMNPGEVHACNPIDGQPWSYRMLYVDTGWLASLQPDGRFRPYAARSLRSPRLYGHYMAMFDALLDPACAPLRRDELLVGFFTRLEPATGEPDPPPARLERAAAYIDAHFAAPLRLEDIAAAAGLSVSYLVRAFRQRYGMAPHEYQVNRRIQHGKAGLRAGLPIAQAALEAGFADQAHFQRIFKRLTAATPGQYRGRPERGAA
ncbi:AraC family transcriptional regulator [Massilia sp. KIM]|uniref:AraC family transcriptional regulator n=1 Tax=Massilia sp. KIM TaxID=1955422 RepID=UPI0009D438B1|nr:AraC family transcriptional regulator [Massilia sp. KIM]OON62169.1 AraC family transcriptional regulator [Massilia sp. KIM]